MKTPKLLPCPFCGRSVKLEHVEPFGYPREWGVYCRNCGTHWDNDIGLLHKPRRIVAEAWNRRADPKGEADGNA